MKIRIVEPGWKTFTGEFGSLMFENGVAESDSKIAIDRVSSIVAVKEVLKDGKSGFGVSPTNAMIYDRDMPLPSLEKPEPAKSKVRARAKYSRKQLEKIADEKGIEGLREVAKEFSDVKDRSVPRLIDKILAASLERARLELRGD